MANRFGLDGGMIPRTVKRAFDQREEPRNEASHAAAVLTARGRDRDVRLVNLSPSGAMAVYDGTVHIGEHVSLTLLDKAAVTGHVRWVRDGRVGIHFDAPAG